MNDKKTSGPADPGHNPNPAAASAAPSATPAPATPADLFRGVLEPAKNDVTLLLTVPLPAVDPSMTLGALTLHYLRDLVERKDVIYADETVKGYIWRALTMAKCWPGYTEVSLADLGIEHMAEMGRRTAATLSDPLLGQCNAGTYNATVGTVARTLSFAAESRIALVTMAQARMLREAIVYKPLDSEVPIMPTHEQEEGMIAYAEGRCSRTHQRQFDSLLTFHFLRSFGVRKGMLKTIRFCDYDRDSGHITFRFNKKRNGARVALTLAVPTRLRTLVDEYLDTFRPPPEGHLFIFRNISQMLASAAASVGLPGFSPHDFRHLFITRCIELGVDPETIAILVGHSDCGVCIRKTYFHRSPKRLDATVHRRDGSIPDDPDEARRIRALRHECDLALDTILAGPIAQAKQAAAHLRRLGQLARDGHIEEFNRLTAPAALLDPKPADGAPMRVKYQPKHLRDFVASAIRNLLWRKGVSVHAATKDIGIEATCVYDMLNGKRQHADKLQKLATYFGVKESYFTDRNEDHYDRDLVVANVVYAANRYSIKELPCPGDVGLVVQGRKLPCGQTLRELATFLGIELEILLTTDISTADGLPEANQKSPLTPAPQADGTAAGLTLDEAKKRLSHNLVILALLAGIKAANIGKSVGLRDNQLYDYLNCRHLPPVRKQELLANYFQIPVVDLFAPVARMNPALLGNTITALLAAKGYTPSTAAFYLTMSSVDFRAAAAGTKLPNPVQLHRLANFLGLRPAELLERSGIVLPQSYRGVQARGEFAAQAAETITSPAPSAHAATAPEISVLASGSQDNTCPPEANPTQGGNVIPLPPEAKPAQPEASSEAA